MSVCCIWLRAHFAAVQSSGTGNLDDHTGETISGLLFDLVREAGATFVLVTHDNDLAARCERVLSLHAGTFAAEGSVSANPPAQAAS